MFFSLQGAEMLIFAYMNKKSLRAAFKQLLKLAFMPWKLYISIPLIHEYIQMSFG